jgi:hypothetical protein
MNAKIIRADNRLRVYTAIALVVIIVCGFVTYDWTQRALVEIEKLARPVARSRRESGRRREHGSSWTHPWSRAGRLVAGPSP